MSVFGWLKKDATAREDGALLRTIRSALPSADDDSVRVVAACAGLLASVAYADRDFSEHEAARIYDLLQTIQGIGAPGASAIVAALREEARHHSTVEAPRFSRTLKELGDRDLRCHLLELLLEVAAADHAISHNEVAVLRQLTTSLGLEQSDYNAAQEKHKAKLSTLR